MQTNPTQLTGLIAFAIAALACARAARRQRGPWVGLLIAQLVCFAEVWFGLRHRLHDLADVLLRSRGMYASRVGLQEALIAAALLLVGVGLATSARWWRRDARVALAMLGTGLAFTLFVIETISLHAIDVLMYEPLGPVMLVALAWSAGAALVAAAAWQVARP